MGHCYAYLQKTDYGVLSVLRVCMRVYMRVSVNLSGGFNLRTSEDVDTKFEEFFGKIHTVVLQHS